MKCLYNIKNLIILLLGILFISSAVPSALNSDFYSIQKSKILKVCSQAGFIPFEMKNNRGEWLGFDYEFMKAYAQHNKVKLVFIDTDMDGLIPTLLAHKCHAIASGLTVTEERAKKVLFSDIMFETKLAFGVKKNREFEVKDAVSYFNSAKFKIAVHTGTTASIFAQKHLKKATIMIYKTQTDMVNALLAGYVDAFFEEDFFIEMMNAKYPDKIKLFKTEEVANFAIAVQKNEPLLVASLNEFLQSWRKSGQYQKWYEYFFKQKAWLKFL